MEDTSLGIKNKETESFFTLVNKHKNHLGLQDKELAAKAGISAPTYSLMMNGEARLSFDTGMKIIEALKPNRIDRRKMFRGLAEVVDSPSNNRLLYSSFGELLNELCERANMDTLELSQAIGKSRPAVGQWRRGLFLPSYEVLEQICQILSEKKIKKSELARLRKEYLFDWLRNDSKLSSFPETKRNRIARAAADVAFG